MGMFDDLIPSKGGGMFDDLIPKKRKRGAVEEVTGFMANVNRGLGVGDEMAAAARTAVNATRDGLAGKRGPNIVDRYKAEMGGQRDIEDSYARDRPNVAALGRGTGMAASAVAPFGQTTNALATAGRATNMARGAVSAGLSGATYAAVDRGSARERLSAASRAAIDPATLALGAAAGALAPALPGRRRQRISDDVRTLRQNNVEVTPGQAGGDFTKRAEEVATSLPVVGDAISGAQTRGREQFNRQNLQLALREIGEELPAEIATGSDAIRHTGDRLSAAYQRVIPEGRVGPDEDFIRGITDNLGDVAQDLTPAGRQRLNNIIQNRVVSRLQGGADGQAFQRMTGELTSTAKRFTSSTDADQRAIGEALLIVRDEAMAAAARQNPQFAQAKAQIDRGWAQLATVETAGAKAGAEGGIYSPKQFMAAKRAGDSSVRNRATARGDLPGQEFAGAAERVLSNKTPDSGTARRMIQGGGLIGGGALAVTNPLAAVGAAAGVGAGTAAYSQPGIALFNRILDRSIGAEDRAMALNQLRQMAAQSPEAQRLYQEVMGRLPGAAGVASQAPMAVGY